MIYAIVTLFVIVIVQSAVLLYLWYRAEDQTKRLVVFAGAIYMLGKLLSDVLTMQLEIAGKLSANDIALDNNMRQLAKDVGVGYESSLQGAHASDSEGVQDSEVALERLDDILDKISESGIENISKEELDVLRKISGDDR